MTGDQRCARSASAPTMRGARGPELISHACKAQILTARSVRVDSVSEGSPCVRRMMAVVGSDTTLDAGHQPMHLLAGLCVSTESVERRPNRSAPR